MKKFSKIVESASAANRPPEDITEDIRNIFIDMIDDGIKVIIQRYRSFYIIRVHGDKYSDALTVMSDILVATERISTLGLKYVQSNTETDISVGKKISIFLKYQYGDVDETKNKDVKTWYEFKDYCNNVLGIDGIQGDIFKLNVATPEGFPGSDKYWGWEIYAGEGEIEDLEDDLAKEFPKYADFFKKILSRKLDWDNLWRGDDFDTKKGNPLKFDKEGIEVVEKLLEIAKEYPDKIEVIKK